MKSEKQIESDFIQKLQELKYIYREDIRDKVSLEANFREHFENLNHVKLSDSEFARLKDSIITPDVFSAAKTLREINEFKRDDDTPLYYSLVNIKDWCKNNFEVINQLRINTDNSSHRYDVIILINGVPVVQVELKSPQITPKKAMEQIVTYKNDAGNGYSNSLLCFMQLFIVSNEINTNLDEVIAVQAEKIETLKLHKKRFDAEVISPCAGGERMNAVMDTSLKNIANKISESIKNIILLFAFNSTGKTGLSVEYIQGQALENVSSFLGVGSISYE